MRYRWGAVVLAAGIAGCSSGSGDGSTAPVATTVVPVAETTAAAGSMGTTTDAPSTTPPANDEAPPSTTTPIPLDGPPAIDMGDPGECEWPAEAPASGQVTFVVDERLWSSETLDVDRIGSARCIADLGHTPATLAWSRDGDQLLLDSSTVLGVDGELSTGFDASAAQVRWSMPTGVRTIAVEGDALHKMQVGTTDLSDVTFLARHELVAYHPAGHHFVSSGTDEQGQFGIFLADNDGHDARMIVRGESEPVISDLSFDGTGDQLFFVAQHDGHHHLHSLAMAGLVLIDLFEGDKPIGPLAADPAGYLVAARFGDCSIPTSVVSNAHPDPLSAPAVMGPMWLDPVGWSGGSLLLAARPNGCTGPADIYLQDSVALSEGRWSARLLVREVDVATVRSPAIEPNKLNTEAMPIESEAPA